MRKITVTRFKVGGSKGGGGLECDDSRLPALVRKRRVDSELCDFTSTLLKKHLRNYNSRTIGTYPNT